MLEQFFLGGPMMYPLIGCSILALAVVLDRIQAFYQNSKCDSRALRAKILELLEENRLDDALTLCSSTPGPVSAVLLVGLQTYRKLRKAGESQETIRNVVTKAMSDFYDHAMSAVEKRFSLLSMIGMASPLLGMTGTVTGMIRSFDAMANAASLDNTMVAGGISEALITTAWGLIIALFAVIPWNIFTGKSEQIGLDIEEASSELVEYISLHSPESGV